MTVATVTLWMVAGATAYSATAEHAGESAQTQAQQKPFVSAETNGKDFDHLSLDELLDNATAVATLNAKSSREAAGVITVLTRDELMNAGVRDLIDVLHLVPGFSPQADVQGVVGIGFRGNWAHEGKILLLLDGLEMNERAFTNTALGNHYPIEHIERIEIIRGPGSAIYGGYAELGVINIVTRSAKEIGGASVSGLYGRMSEVYGRRNLSLQVGKDLDDLELSVSGFIGQGTRSQGTLETFYGEIYNMGAKSSPVNPMMLNVGAKIEGLSLRYIFDNYMLKSRIAFGDELGPFPLHTDFWGHYVDAHYDLRLLDDKMTITPSFRFKWTQSWRQRDELDTDEYTSASYTFNDTTEALYVGGVTASYDVIDGINVRLGLEAAIDRTVLNDAGNVEKDSEPGEWKTYKNYAGYAQVDYENPYVNFTAGVRAENHSEFGSSVVPRLGLTKVIDRFHAKILLAQSFRTPGFAQVTNGVLEIPEVGEEAVPGIRPEKSTIAEIEAGYQILESLHLNLNVFDITVKDPVIYTYDTETEAEYYFNEKQTGSRGVEAEIRFKMPSIYANATYSFYTTARKNKVETFAVEHDKNVVVGLPSHKVTFNTSFEAIDGLTINPSGVYIGERYAYVAVDDEDETVLETEDAAIMLNLFVRYRLTFVEGLEVALGVYDILDSGYRFVQPYNGYHPPLPGPSREVLARVGYSVAF